MQRTMRCKFFALPALLVALALELPAQGLPAQARKPGHGALGQATAPLVHAPAVRWSFESLSIESEPVASGGHVFVHGRDPSGRRALVLLDQGSGRVLSRTLFAAKTPLQVDVAGERVAVRAAPNRIDLFRLRGARLVNERSFTYTHPVSAPLLEEDALTLSAGQELVRYDLRRNAPLWRLRRAGTFHGAARIAGEDVLALWVEANGNVHLARIGAADGQVREEIRLGRHKEGNRPSNTDSATLTVHSDEIFAHLGAPIPATGGLDSFSIQIPNEMSLIGFNGAMQAILLAGLTPIGACNALHIKLGL